jgi:hypothetical protein
MFCIITPVFDEAFISVKGLIQDLKEQTFGNFKHIFISNGKSGIIEKIINEANDGRFIYVERPYEQTPKTKDILINIAHRRNYAIDNFPAERYFFFDADLLITAKNFLEVISKVHDKADVILSKITLWYHELPVWPICLGNIDIANYSFSKKVADLYEYPTDYDCTKGIANDWRFYEKMINESHYINDMVYAKKDGRHCYRNLSSRYSDEVIKGLYDGPRPK